MNGSWYEGFGLPTLEAMSCGVPVVQADNRGLDSIICHKENCVVYSPAEVNILSNSIEIIIRDEVLRNKIIQGGINTASNFTLVKQFDQFVKIFEKILVGKFNKNVVESVKFQIENGNSEDKLSLVAKELYPKFSVIIPIKNFSLKISETVESLLNQVYENWEALLVYNSDDEKMA